MKAEIKQLIVDLLNSGVTKPNKILECLREKGLTLPKKSQLTNFLQVHRQNISPPILSLGSLENHVTSLRQIPEEEDKAYVTHCIFDYNDKWFGVSFSTRRLLNLTTNHSSIQCDATYKLCWEGFPILITGITDKKNTFHPISISITTGETARDYEFIFNSLKKAIGQSYKPSLLIADASEAITNGFAESFGTDFKRAYCSFHVLKNVDSKRNLVKNKSKWLELRNGIIEIQLSRSTDHFQAISKLWSKMYMDDPETKDFCNYLKEEYLDRRQNWYEGYALGFPSTNNGLEATNRWIKSQGTLRNRLPMGELMNFLIKQSNSWSYERNPSNPNCKFFAEEPLVSLKIETAAFQWSQAQPDIKFRTSGDGNHVTYFISASGKPKLKEDEINKYLRVTSNCSWRTFDGYLSSITRLWMVTLNKSNWKLSGCTCPFYLKKNICKHIVGLAINLKLTELSASAKDIPLGKKRKRGRPGKATKALIVD